MKIIIFKFQKNKMQLMWSSSASLKDQKNFRSCDFCSFKFLRKRKLRLIMKIIMFKCKKNKMQLVWSSSAISIKSDSLKNQKNSRSCDFCSFRFLRKRKLRLVMKIIMFNFKFGHHPDQIRLFEELEKILDPVIFVVLGLCRKENYDS